MRAVWFWLAVGPLTGLLLFFVGVVALTLAMGIWLAFALPVHGSPLSFVWLLVWSAIFAAPLVAVVLIFRGALLPRPKVRE